ncbi:hypothetical protein BGZ60DRAFT_446762 [Tricladium varicosporioides]|nr:hypothetical protein BGZ60DRAFT_446762 [Hymenoscyphus varicosporioides]
MAVAPNPMDMDMVSICFGFSLAFCVLTGSKAARQTFGVYRRTHSLFNLYLWMIWAEGIVNFIMSIISWLFIRGNIRGSFSFFFILVSLWVVQTQCLIQIIANRVGLIMVNKRKVRIMKWTLFVIIGLVNISVYCIWIPARTGVSQTFVRINNVWDRIEKVIYLIIDGALNGLFLYLVRAKLISGGLTKYKPLFNFNAFIVCVSLSMDVLIICMMSLPNSFIYIQFHPLAYIVKLNIELSMADLISKIVRRQDRVDNPYSNSNPTELTSNPRHDHFHSKRSVFSSPNGQPTQVSHIYASKTISDSGEGEINTQNRGPGIMKTIATVVQTVEKDDSESVSSSMKQLNECRNV